MDPADSAGNMIDVRGLAMAFTIAIIVVPVIALVGWLGGMPVLASYGGQFIPMAPSTAICFLLIALPLYSMLRPAQGPVRSHGAGLAGVLVAAYGFLVAFAWLTGLPINPEELLFRETGILGTHRVGHMSPVTGLLFFLAGISFTALVRGLSRKSSPGRIFSLATFSGGAVLLTGAVFALGYTLGAPLLYESQAIPLALPTAISFLLLGCALTTAAALYSPLAGRWYGHLNDLPIGTQLRLSLGAIMAFVLLLGALAWMKTDLIWLQTKTMYDHPMQVRRAIGYLNGTIESMSRQVRDLLLAQNEEERATARQNIAIENTDAERHLAILFDRYLGPREDIIALQHSLGKWNALRDETIHLLEAGKTAAAAARIRPGGVQDLQAQEVWHDLHKIDDFARNKGDQLYQTATQQKDALNRQLLVIVAAILLLSLLISWCLLKGIKDPLQQLTAAAEEFRQGNMAVRSRYVSANEFGVLSAAFNAQADMVATELHLKEQAAQLAGVMLRESEARSFCRELLKGLVAHTDSQIGAVYLLNPQKTEFEHFESIGLGSGGRTAFSALAPEGEFSAILAKGGMQRITAIPDDTPFIFATVAGDFKPREIVTIPLFLDNEAVAVLSLASLHHYGTNAVRLLEGVLDIMSARLNGVLAYRQIQELAEQLDHQNRELEEQKRELAAQTTELTEQNTELEQQKRQLDEANRLKSAFLSNMSHELRTPLNSVIALAGVLSRRLSGSIPEEQYGYLEVIERNGRHLLALINDILDLSRIEAGKEEINCSQFSMRTLVGEVLAVLEPQARENKIALLNHVRDDLPSILSDADMCLHILQNLVSNAVKFTETGSVEIMTRQVGDQLHVAVRDTGIGIAADQLLHIFDEFRQVDGSSSRKYGGTGLGLAIARKYATLLQGDITVESTPGRGSTFTLRLPLTLSRPDTDTGDYATLPAGSVVGQRPPPGQGQRILLVEDSEPAVIQLTDILTEQGYEVQVARNGKEALTQIQTSAPDAVILDLMMPEMDGFEVLRQIRGTENSVLLPVLILTAKHVTREELSFLKGNHIYQLIQKGDIGRSELLSAVAKMVAPPGELPAPPAWPRARKPRQDPPVILVVEDNIDNLLTMRALLQESYTLIEAMDGREGIEQARQHVPDLILSDLSMPVMDGFALLAAIRADEALCDIPVVAVTASAMKGSREEILARGFDGYLSKPVDEELLQKTVREALNGNN